MRVDLICLSDGQPAPDWPLGETRLVSATVSAVASAVAATLDSPAPLPPGSPAPSGSSAPLGYIVGGGLKEGFRIRLTVPADTVQEGSFVVCESGRYRYFGLVTDLQLVSDIAEPYDVVIVGADKWAQLHDPVFYGGSASARDQAVASRWVLGA